MLKTALLAAMAILTFAMPASAQYYGGYGRGYDYYDDEPRPRRRYDYDRDYGRPAGPPPGAYGRRGGAVSLTCSTPRGSCQSTPMPVGGGCVCFVPGIGNVPGRVR